MDSVFFPARPQQKQAGEEKGNKNRQQQITHILLPEYQRENEPGGDKVDDGHTGKHTSQTDFPGMPPMQKEQDD